MMNTHCIIFVAAILGSLGRIYAQQATSLVIQGTLRDQAPDYMIHANYPTNYWTCAFEDNPTDGNAGKANSGKGFANTDFELPQWAYGQADRIQTATTCTEAAGETGMMGTVCSAANKWSNCATLAADNTPNYIYPGQSPLGSIQSPASFYTWFHDSPTTMSVIYNLTLTNIGGRLYQYSNQNFFPLDGIGWADSNLASDNQYHNFAFCLDIHGYFAYEGGETFSFEGDDDLWVYLDSRLVIDLGGPHPQQNADISLDSIAGLTIGNGYRFDMFYCERHTTESNLEITTSINIQCTYYDWCGSCQGNGQSCCSAADIATCSDNNACTMDECAVLVPPQTSCQHTPITCTTSSLCYIPSCNITTGCVYTPVVCNDNSLCTMDTCVNATGCLFTNVTCPGDKCHIPSCNPATGCSTTIPNCDDKNSCTADSCNGTVGCQNLPITCNDNNLCTTDSCNPLTGCVFTPVVCDDNNACTNDTCAPTTGCAHTPIPCNDNDACTADTCNVQKGCAHANITCNATNACFLSGCSAKIGCTNTAVNCNDGNACTTEICDATKGCQYTNVVCNDHNACTTDTCDIKAGCIYTPIACSTANLCTNNTCDTITGCTYSPINCNDNNACTNDSCIPSIGCVHSDLSCNSNNPCFVDSCSVTAGCTTTPQECNHCTNATGVITCPPTNGDLCFPVSCDPNSGACNISRAVNCSDSNNCTIDKCVNGVCSFTAVDCTDSDSCTIDSCSVTSGGCLHTPKDCNDNNPCTTDLCTVGNCSNTPVDGNCLACGDISCLWNDSCNPVTCVSGACVVSPYICNDNNLCTSDTCVNGATASCSYTPVVCDDTDLCNPQSCSSVNGSCVGIPVDCDDGNLCTTDQCSNGMCIFPPVLCDQSNLCSPQTCNTTTGTCTAVPVYCDDNNACTDDTCNPNTATCEYTPLSCAGEQTPDLCTPSVCDTTLGCVPGTTICDDNNPCTADICIGYMNCTHTLGVCEDENNCTVATCDSNARTLGSACSYSNVTCTPSICQNVTGCNPSTGCQFAPLVCPTPADWCQLPLCDPTAGCVSYTRACVVSDPDCYIGVCNSVLQKCITSERPNWAIITTKKGGGETCFVYYDKAAGAGIITAGVVAGIVIGAVVVAALFAAAGRKAYLYMQLRQAGTGPAHGNPLYTPTPGGGENPLFNS